MVTFGQLLKDWRKAKNFSQLNLANEADISARHLSFLETGRADPSREMVLHLSSVMNLPLRERNLLLTAAGFACAHGEKRLTAPDLEQARWALSFILEQQNPFPALVVDGDWNLLMGNQSNTRLMDRIQVQIGRAMPGPPFNLLEFLFDPRGLRPLVANWPEVASTLLQRLRRERTMRPGNSDPLIERLFSFPDVPAGWRDFYPVAHQLPVVPLELVLGSVHLSFITMLTTFGTPIDVTLQELRLESYFPADEATRTYMQRLAE